MLLVVAVVADNSPVARMKVNAAGPSADVPAPPDLLESAVATSVASAPATSTTTTTTTRSVTETTAPPAAVADVSGDDGSPENVDTDDGPRTATATTPTTRRSGPDVTSPGSTTSTTFVVPPLPPRPADCLFEAAAPPERALRLATAEAGDQTLAWYGDEMAAFLPTESPRLGLSLIETHHLRSVYDLSDQDKAAFDAHGWRFGAWREFAVPTTGGGVIGDDVVRVRIDQFGTSEDAVSVDDYEVTKATDPALVSILTPHAAGLDDLPTVTMVAHHAMVGFDDSARWDSWYRASFVRGNRRYVVSWTVSDSHCDEVVPLVQGVETGSR